MIPNDPEYKGLPWALKETCGCAQFNTELLSRAIEKATRVFLVCKKDCNCGSCDFFHDHQAHMPWRRLTFEQAELEQARSKPQSDTEVCICVGIARSRFCKAHD